MKRLFIIEGTPCSGKSTLSAYVANELKKKYNVCFVDEGTGNHPADFEFHSLLKEKDFVNFSKSEMTEINSVSEKFGEDLIVPLSCVKDELFNKLLCFKIYDFLPWDTEYPVMLKKWENFVRNSDDDTVYVFNCVLLQNPMCETMMRFGFSFDQSLKYIDKIVQLIKPLEPVLIYIKNDNIADSVRKVSVEREGWLDEVVKYHINGEYGKSINANGFDGYIACLEERQRRELEIIKYSDIQSLILDNPQRNWQDTYKKVSAYIL